MRSTLSKLGAVCGRMFRLQAWEGSSISVASLEGFTRMRMDAAESANLFSKLDLTLQTVLQRQRAHPLHTLRFNAPPSGFTKEIVIATTYGIPRLAASPQLDSEESARIVYSLHPNGSVIVLLYPHSSSWRPEIGPYIIRMCANARQLLGADSNSRIQRDINLGRRLALFTMAQIRPSRRSQAFTKRLVAKHSRWLSKYHHTARESEFASQTAMLVGLIAGLIASSIIPLMVEVGRELATVKQDTLALCSLTKDAAADRAQACLSMHDHPYLKWGVLYLTPTWILLSALLLTSLAFAELFWQRRKYLRAIEQQ